MFRRAGRSPANLCTLAVIRAKFFAGQSVVWSKPTDGVTHTALTRKVGFGHKVVDVALGVKGERALLAIARDYVGPNVSRFESNGQKLVEIEC